MLLYTGLVRRKEPWLKERSRTATNSRSSMVRHYSVNIHRLKSWQNATRHSWICSKPSNPMSEVPMHRASNQLKSSTGSLVSNRWEQPCPTHHHIFHNPHPSKHGHHTHPNQIPNHQYPAQKEPTSLHNPNKTHNPEESICNTNPVPQSRPISSSLHWPYKTQDKAPVLSTIRIRHTTTIPILSTILLDTNYKHPIYNSVSAVYPWHITYT